VKKKATTWNCSGPKTPHGGLANVQLGIKQKSGLQLQTFLFSIYANYLLFSKEAGTVYFVQEERR